MPTIPIGLRLFVTDQAIGIGFVYSQKCGSHCPEAIPLHFYMPRIMAYNIGLSAWMHLRLEDPAP
jgi:hypothetical protein